MLLLSLLLFSETTEAQFTRYLVKFKHKGGTPFTIANPAAYLSQRAIDRRTRYGIAIDSTDLPVNPASFRRLCAECYSFECFQMAEPDNY